MDGGVPMFEPGMPAIARFAISVRLGNQNIQRVYGTISPITAKFQLFAPEIAPGTPTIQLFASPPTPNPIQVQGWLGDLAALASSLARATESMVRRGSHC
jgi:hypothetical protein